MIKRTAQALLFLFMLAAGVTMLFHGCMPEVAPLSPPAADPGSARLERLVAIGDRYMAGMTDGALGEFGQQFSVPALVAAAAGVDSFRQPLLQYPGIGRELVSNKLIGRKLLLSFSPLTITSLSVRNTSASNLLAAPPWDNFAVPQHKIADAIDKDSDDGSTGPIDHLTNLILQGNGSQLEQALARDPGLAMVWLGLNDALGAALTAVVRDGENLTLAEDYRGSLETIISRLDSAGVQILIATIPDVTYLPYLRATSTVIINPGTGDTVRTDRSDPQSWVGYRVVWSDSTERTLSADPASPDFGLLSLGARTFLKNGFGVPFELGGINQPLPDDVVLDQDEISLIRSRIDAFNQSIRDVAGLYGAVVVDTHALFARLFVDGYRAAGFRLTAAYVTGGLFSLDAVHPTPTCYAIIANEFIKAINANFGAGIPPVSILQ